jgi:hypothetical protein
LAKLILFSILIATIAIPMNAAGGPKPAAAMKKMIITMLVFELFWFLALVFVYGRVAT